VTRKTKLVAAGLAAASIVALGAAPAQAATVTVAPAAPGSSPLDNSWPFGQGPNWGNNMGFIYKNIPAFSLKAGDTISFDLVQENEQAPLLEIGMAQTTVSGGDLPAAPFTPIVPNTVVPTGKGNTVVDDYDLTYRVATPYSFPGGGLIIKFTNRSPAFTDGTSTQVFLDRQTTGADPSGQFAHWFAQDPDGAPPWSLLAQDRIAGFRLNIADSPAAANPTNTKKCKKKKKKKGKGAESAAKKKKKKCKKKKKKK
jgi:hypothetical protein